MPSNKVKQITDVHKAIELINFPLWKKDWYEDVDTIEINDWKEVFNTFGLEYMQKDIIIDFHPYMDTYSDTDKTHINLLMGKLEDIAIYKMAEDWWNMEKYVLDVVNNNQDDFINYNVAIHYVKIKEINNNAK